MSKRVSPDINPVTEVAFLPENLEFEQLIEGSASQRLTFWSTEEVFEIDGPRLPGPLSEGFFFPERTRITSAKFDLSEYLTDDTTMWHFQALFSVQGGFDYQIRFNNQAGEEAVITTTDFNGNEIASRISGLDVLQFLLVLYNEHLNKSRSEKTVDILDVFKSHEEYRDVDNLTFRKLLPKLGELSGCTQSRTVAELPYPRGNRQIFVLLSKKTMPDKEVTDIDIDIASETDAGEIPIDRVLLHSGASSPPEPSDNIYAQISKIDIPLRSFASYREMPELMNASVAAYEQIDGKRVDPKEKTPKEKTDPRLFKLASFCMHILTQSLEASKPEQP